MNTSTVKWWHGEDDSIWSARVSTARAESVAHLAESRIHDTHDAAEADLARIRAELTDRLDRCDPFAHEAALRWLAHENPDAVNEALTETGGPNP